MKKPGHQISQNPTTEGTKKNQGILLNVEYRRRSQGKRGEKVLKPRRRGGELRDRVKAKPTMGGEP